MKEVAGAVVAISIVLVAVFVPVALFPGTTGAIYRQFALTIAASVALSTFCALTLTPALCARLLKRHARARSGSSSARWTRCSTGRAARYGRGCCAGCSSARSLVLRRPSSLCLGATVAALPRGAHRLHPRRGPGLPHHLGAGARGHVARPDGEGAAPRWRRCCARSRRCASCSPSAASRCWAPAPTWPRSSSTLKPWEEREGEEQSVAAMVERLRGPLGRIGGARVVPFQPPAIRGVGSVGGFQFVVEDTSGSRSLDELAAAAQELVAQGQRGQPRCAASSPPSPPTRRCWTWRWTGRRPRRSASPSSRSSARCRSTWAASTSTTSNWFFFVVTRQFRVAYYANCRIV